MPWRIPFYFAIDNHDNIYVDMYICLSVYYEHEHNPIATKSIHYLRAKPF